jgi:hypothetical protein
MAAFDDMPPRDHPSPKRAASRSGLQLGAILFAAPSAWLKQLDHLDAASIHDEVGRVSAALDVGPDSSTRQQPPIGDPSLPSRFVFVRKEREILPSVA